jgi:hypothetical protein
MAGDLMGLLDKFSRVADTWVNSPEIAYAVNRDQGMGSFRAQRQKQIMQGLLNQRRRQAEADARASEQEKLRQQALMQLQGMAPAGSPQAALLMGDKPMQNAAMTSLLNPQQGGFTLSPGQQRFGGDGTPLASGGPSVNLPPQAKAELDHQYWLKQNKITQDQRTAEAQAKTDKEQAAKQEEQRRNDDDLLGSLYKAADLMSTPNFHDAVGPLDDWTAPIGGLFNSDDSRTRSAAERYLKTEVLDESAKMKGPITEKEWPKVERTKPSLKDHADKWVDWYLDQVLPALKRSQPHLVEQIEKLEQQVLSAAQQNFGYSRVGMRHEVGQIITVDGRRYRVKGGDMNDPDLEPVQ